MKIPPVSSVKVRRWSKRAAAAGALLALVCPFLPPSYQAPCHAVAAICTGVVP